jgi:hypothetical protein
MDNGVEGALNYSFTGYHGDATYFKDETDIKTGRSMVFTSNPWSVSARPDAPTALTAAVDGKSVKLSWTAASSSMKNVTYEYYLKETSRGIIYNNVSSFIGGEKDGKRKVLRDGNAYMNTSMTLTLPDGTYEWGVQTVNAAQRGSVFATGQTFIIGTGTGIKSTFNDDSINEVARYNTCGQAISGPQKGINVIKMSNGDVKKIFIK